MKGLGFFAKAFYISLYRNSDYVGYIQEDQYYEPSGNVTNQIDDNYYTLSVDTTPGVGQYNYVSEIYLDYGKKLEKNLYVSSVQELQHALEIAAQHANPCLVYNIHVFPGEYDIFNNWDLSTVF